MESIEMKVPPPDAIRAALAHYREARRFDSPAVAARGVRDSCARYIADSIVAGREPGRFMLDYYRAAVDVSDAVDQRCAWATPADDAPRSTLYFRRAPSRFDAGRAA